MADGAGYRLRPHENFASDEGYSLTDEVINVGREPQGNTIVITAPGVSRQHALLRRMPAGYVIEDLGSTNGTFINDQRLAGPRLLQPGDVVRLGQIVTLVFEAPNAAAMPVDVSLPPATILDDRHAQITQTLVPPSPQPPPAHAAPPTLPQQPPAQAMPAAAPPDAAPFGQPATVVTTMFSTERDAAAEPPRLIVDTAGQGRMTFTLTDTGYTLGRADDNSLQITSPLVSRRHARLERVLQDYYLFVLPEARNPITVAGRPLTGPHKLEHNDVLRIGGTDPGVMVSLTYLDPERAQADAPVQIDFGDRSEIQLGRDAANDVRLDAPAVSRFHAVIQRVGQRYRVRDLRSVNGTFVNDVRVAGEVWLQPKDTVRVGPYSFVVGESGLVQHDESGGLHVEVLGLNKQVRKDLNILQNIYLAIQPREFVVLVGLSGAGKSTLMDAIAGYRPATHGQVLVNGTNVYQHFDAIRNNIGYVPQRDIIHMELSVFQALDYAAQLRMPADTSRRERHQRINEVLADLDLTERRDVPVAKLSGGQQKRVSIGVELLTKPGLFFLDEPTSGLDPGTETALMQLMRRLADQGRTIILITHATKNVMLADKVVFLVRGGYLAWYGPPDEALKYFDQFRSERERRAANIEFDDIYKILESPDLGGPKDWADRYMALPAYQQYVVQPLHERAEAVRAAAPQAGRPGATAQEAGAFGLRRAPAGARPPRGVSSLRQFIILSLRNLSILVRDRFSLGLMLLTAPLVALLTAAVAKPNAFDAALGDYSEAFSTIFLMLVFALMFGITSQMREFVKEQDIYKRERRVGLKLFPYVLSKVWLILLLALYQSAVYIVGRYARVHMPGGLPGFMSLYVTLVLVTIAGMMLGLLASALAPNSNSAPLISILFVFPQMLLSGALLPLQQLGPVAVGISSVVSARWAFEAAITTTGMGRDVARDACWLLPEDERDALTADQKDANCMCMGINIFNGARFGRSCYFPGLQEFYRPEVDLPAPVRPVEPLEPGPAPARPIVPPEPERPPANDLAAQQQYLLDLESWQAEVRQINDGFEQQMIQYEAAVDEYRAATERFKAEMEVYQADLGEWESQRTGAIVGAENLLKRVLERYGQAFDVNIASRWLYQLILIFVTFVAVLILLKRKDSA